MRKGQKPQLQVQDQASMIVLRPKILAQSIRFALYGPRGMLATIQTREMTLERGLQTMQAIERRAKNEEPANDTH